MHILVWGGRGRGCTKWAKFGLKKIFCNFENNFQLLINLVLRIGLPISRTTFRNSSWYKCVTTLVFSIPSNLVLRIGIPILRTTFRNSSWYKCVTNISFFSLFSSFKPLKINFKIAKYFFKVNFSQLSTKCTWHDLLLFILH